MINEENKYLSQSDETDSEYRERKKKEEALQRQLRENRLAQENLREDMYKLEIDNENFQNELNQELAFLNSINFNNIGVEEGKLGGEYIIENLRNNVLSSSYRQVEFMEKSKTTIQNQLRKLEENEHLIRKEVDNISI